MIWLYPGWREALRKSWREALRKSWKSEYRHLALKGNAETRIKALEKLIASGQAKEKGK